jgi:hypothetical protein
VDQKRPKPSESNGQHAPEGGLRPFRERPNLEALKALRPEPEDLRFGRDMLDDTVAEEDAALPDDEEVRLDGILDRPQTAVADASLERYDPEAGRTSVAVKVKAVHEAVRNSISTPFGKMILAIPVFLAGIALSIAAITLQETGWIVAAAIVMPLGSFLAYHRYQVWLGSKRYMYRLLESLGEDVSEFSPHEANRRIKVKVRSRR